jgi:hypothetical protein
MSAAIPTGALGVQAQAQALLRRVIEDRERRCAALRAAAEKQATQIVRAARAEARHSVHNAVAQERARLDSGLRQARARADIEARHREQEKSRELLEQMWAGISEALERRWREPALRQAWIEAAMSQSGRLLPGRAWLIEAGTEWSEQERGKLGDRARARGAVTAEYSLQTAIPAGLRIRAGSVCVDATVAGLLAQRDTIEAVFLAEYVPVLAASEAHAPSLSVTPPQPATTGRADG